MPAHGRIPPIFRVILPSSVSQSQETTSWTHPEVCFHGGSKFRKLTRLTILLGLLEIWGQTSAILTVWMQKWIIELILVYPLPLLKELIENSYRNYIFGHLKYILAERTHNTWMVYICEAILIQARRYTLGIAGNEWRIENAQRSWVRAFCPTKTGSHSTPFLCRSQTPLAWTWRTWILWRSKLVRSWGLL